MKMKKYLLMILLKKLKVSKNLFNQLKFHHLTKSENMFKINLLTNNLQNVYEHLNKDVQDRATKHQMKIKEI